MAGEVRVGICSWADPALIEEGSFYPRKSMSADARLRFYASVFDTVEVNSSFYALPDVRTVARWAERTPRRFLFSIKAYAMMTAHDPRLETLPAEVRRLLPATVQLTARGAVPHEAISSEALDECFRLYRLAIDPLVETGKLGYVLFQFAPWFAWSRERLDYVASLRERLPGLTVAVEFRNRSWFPAHGAETLALLRSAGLAHVVVDGPSTTNAVPRVPVATAPAAILRLHGRNADGWLRQLRGEGPSVREKYDYLYREDELQALVPEVEALQGDVERVYVSFNNNNRAYPVMNALMMRRLLGVRPPEPGPPPAALFA
jgi:uncharacterized protein YecE (DUF72 family)